MSSAPDLILEPGFVDEPLALLRMLQAEVEWDQRLRARQTASFGVSYDYSGMTYPQVAMPPALASLRDRIAQRLGFVPNNCLLNRYLDGESSMGFHSDSSQELAEGTGVAIVSLGAERHIVFRAKADRALEFSYALPAGGLLYMPEGIQSIWLHAIPKAPGAGERISLTFRAIER